RCSVENAGGDHYQTAAGNRSSPQQARSERTVFEQRNGGGRQFTGTAWGDRKIGPGQVGQGGQGSRRQGRIMAVKPGVEAKPCEGNSMPLTIRKKAYALGAEVGGVDISKPLDDAAISGIYNAFLEHCVLVFRGQPITRAQHLAFSQLFGEVDKNKVVL